MGSSPATESSPKALLVCHAGAELGIGHLARMLALAEALAGLGSVPRLLLQGSAVPRHDLAALDHSVVGLDADLLAAVEADIDVFGPNVVVLDLHPRLVPDGFAEAASRWRGRGVHLVGVDALLAHCDAVDVMWVPSLLVDPGARRRCGNLHHGWGSFLISKRRVTPEWSPGQRLLVLTGGSDVTRQHATLPAMLDGAVPAGTEITWVRGPFGGSPSLPHLPRASWTVVDAPSGLEELIVATDYALTVFGVTLFELLQHGTPTVVFSPYEERRFPELDEVAAAGAAVVASDAAEAVAAIGTLMADNRRAATLSSVARGLTAVNGADRLARLIHSIVE